MLRVNTQQYQSPSITQEVGKATCQCNMWFIIVYSCPLRWGMWPPEESLNIWRTHLRRNRPSRIFWKLMRPFLSRSSFFESKRLKPSETRQVVGQLARLASVYSSTSAVAEVAGSQRRTLWSSQIIGKSPYSCCPRPYVGRHQLVINHYFTFCQGQ